MPVLNSGGVGGNPFANYLGGGGLGPVAQGIGSIASGFLNDAGKPYERAMDQYGVYSNLGQMTQAPYYWQGVNAMPEFQSWLAGQKDPAAFINNLMGQYSESPWAKFATSEAERAAGNAASASGLLGSTPYLHDAEQRAKDIASEDMGKWLASVLGINTQYGAGLSGEIAGGQKSANALTDMFSNTGRNMAEAAYNKERGRQQNRSNIIGGLLSFF